MGLIGEEEQQLHVLGQGTQGPLRVPFLQVDLEGYPVYAGEDLLGLLGETVEVGPESAQLLPHLLLGVMTEVFPEGPFVVPPEEMKGDGFLCIQLPRKPLFTEVVGEAPSLDLMEGLL